MPPLPGRETFAERRYRGLWHSSIETMGVYGVKMAKKRRVGACRKPLKILVNVKNFGVAKFFSFHRRKKA
jgi:hypothetical protein